MALVQPGAMVAADAAWRPTCFSCGVQVCPQADVDVTARA